jgi:hypothetical protein
MIVKNLSSTIQEFPWLIRGKLVFIVRITLNQYVMVWENADVLHVKAHGIYNYHRVQIAEGI